MRLTWQSPEKEPLRNFSSITPPTAHTGLAGTDRSVTAAAAMPAFFDVIGGLRCMLTAPARESLWFLRNVVLTPGNGACVLPEIRSLRWRRWRKIGA